MNPEIQKLTASLETLQRDFEALNQEFHRNNFSANQDFTKYSNFTSRLKVPHYDALPTTFGEIGEIIESDGILYICTATTPTWTVVGAQVA